MTGKFPIISSDSHMVEPPDLWTDRIDPRFRDRGPRTYFDPTQNMWLFGCDGVPSLPAGSFSGVGTKPLKDGEAPGEDRRAGGWDPAARLEDMAVDGTIAEVLYTSFGFILYWLNDGPLQAACFRAYNDWLAEFCSYAPDRYAGVGLISCYDVDGAVQELQRIRRLGLRAAQIWASPPEDLSFLSTYHDPIWAAAQDLDLPITLHILAGQGSESQGFVSNPNKFMRNLVQPNEIQRSLGQIIFSGTFERFPRLKIVSAENDIGWLPYFLHRADRAYQKFRFVQHQGTPLTRTPSEYFQSNIWSTFIDDPLGLDNFDLIGVDRIMWSSDYPHRSSTWPNSHAVIDREFANVDEVSKLKICRDNAAQLYGFDVAALLAKPLAAATAG